MPLVAHVTTVPASLVFLDGLAARLRPLGLDLVAISSPGPELDAFGERERVAVYGVEMARRITPGRDLIGLARLTGLLRQLRPAIVHAHTPKGGLLGTLAATLAGVEPRIYHMRGLPLVTATGAKRWLLTATERVSCALAHEVLCVSHSLRDVALEHRLCRSDKARVLGAGSGQGVDLGRFDPDRLAAEGEALRDALAISRDALVFGFIGRLVRDKGIHELLEAWSRVRDQIGSAHLVLVGTRDDRDAVAPELLDALAADPRAHELGFRGDVPTVHAALDVLVLPTYREGFPNVPLEASAMRRPVIATRVTGCVDAVVDGVTGKLVPVRDATALAGAMLEYARDPDLRASHGQRGRERVERSFRRETVHRALAHHYQTLLGRHTRPAPRALAEV